MYPQQVLFSCRYKKSISIWSPVCLTECNLGGISAGVISSPDCTNIGECTLFTFYVSKMSKYATCHFCKKQVKIWLITCMWTDIKNISKKCKNPFVVGQRQRLSELYVCNNSSNIKAEKTLFTSVKYGVGIEREYKSNITETTDHET